MWICLNDAFLSIIQPKPGDAAAAGVDPKTHLLVRARRRGDIESLFPRAKVIELDGRDYQFRAYLPRKQVGDALASRVGQIEYTNFKGSVRSRPLHDAYMAVWGIMARLQPRAPYGERARN